MPLRRDLEVREAPAEAEEWATSANAPSRNAGPPCNEWVEHSARSKSPYYFSSSHSFLQLLAIIFFSPLSLSFLTLSIYLLLLFFFPSLVNSCNTRKDSPSFVHPINHFSLLFFHIFFFNYNNTSPARYIDCVVYTIVSSLAKSSRFLRTIIRTNRSSLFPLPCFFFFFPSSRRIRIVLRPFLPAPPHSILFFSLHLSHSLFIAALACSTCVYALLLSQIFIYLFIFIYLLYIIYF